MSGLCSQHTTNIVTYPFLKSSKVNNSYKYDENRENPWFNEDCEEKRHVFLQKLNIFRTFKNDESRIMMARARSEYKITIRCARYKFDRQKRFILSKPNLIIFINIDMSGWGM